jgi:virulence-associated protein VagC
LGEYVRVAISGRELTQVVAIPRDALRDGNTVWIVKKDHTLDIRPVEIAWRDERVVYLSKGVVADDLIVLSDLAAPIAGMPLTVQSDNAVSPQTSDGQGSVQ